MSFSSDVYLPNINGKEIIATLYQHDLDIPNCKGLLETYSSLFVTSKELMYDTDSIFEAIKKEYTVHMTDYYVSEIGWRVWVSESNEPLVIPLKDIPSEEESVYTLNGDRLYCLDQYTDAYKRYVIKNDLYYVYTNEDKMKCLDKLSKKFNKNIQEFPETYIITNSW